MTPFNVPYRTGRELGDVEQVLGSSHFQGDGPFTKVCSDWLSQHFSSLSLLTTSCTDALEMAATLISLKVGDEVICPSYTFVSSVLPFVSRGASIKFIDVNSKSGNSQVEDYESAITEKTVALIAVNYAGGSSDLVKVRELCNQHGLVMVEDAAQSLGSSYDSKPCGSFGHLSTLSFHATKNIQCGEGGALIVNDQKYQDRAYIIREKGTNRHAFSQGEVDKYTWHDFGSSHLPNEITAACLKSQLQNMTAITHQRVAIWQEYAAYFRRKEIDFIEFPDKVQSNGHLFGIFTAQGSRKSLQHALSSLNVSSAPHYVPLHSSPMGRKHGTPCGSMSGTNHLADNMLRLPLYPDLDIELVLNQFDKLDFKAFCP
jgi:dTDP-4-amino-4,6-dideoxygalactose transaminase